MARIDQDEARRHAEAHLRGLDSDEPLVILNDETRQTPKGWLFFYNSASFAESGNFLDALAGNGPLLVSDEGVVTELDSATPWEEQIAA